MRKLAFLLAGLLLLSGHAFSQANYSSANINAASADCSTSESCVTLVIRPEMNSATVQISSPTATAPAFIQYLVFEATTDGANWQPVQAVSPLAGMSVLAAKAVTGAIGAGVWRINVSGFVGLRVRCTNYFSGISYAAIRASIAPVTP